MGELRLNDIGYSNTDTGVLMLNGINYTGGGSGGGGGGGGSQFEELTKGGQISFASGRYGSVDIPDLAPYKYVILKAYTTINGTEYTYYHCLETATIIGVSRYTWSAQFEATVGGSIVVGLVSGLIMTETTVACGEYRGNWLDIFVDVYGTSEELFPA